MNQLAELKLQYHCFTTVSASVFFSVLETQYLTATPFRVINTV